MNLFTGSAEIYYSTRSIAQLNDMLSHLKRQIDLIDGKIASKEHALPWMKSAWTSAILLIEKELQRRQP